MSWEFPAVSQTRIDFWKEPQFTRKGMFIFTVIFGMFGLHHLLFRSPQTWILFLITNIFSLGYFYFYDLIQLWITPIEELNKYGLHSPFGALGLAQGMFSYIPVTKNPESTTSSAPTTPTVKPTALPAELYYSQTQKDIMQGGSPAEPPPNPWWFFLYFLLLPLQPLAKYIAGDTGYAMTSLLSLTVIPFGWLFSIFMMGSEYFNLFFRPKQVFQDGIHRIFPFTSVWLDKYGYSKRLTGNENGSPECDGFLVSLLKNILTAFLPYLRTFIPPEVIMAIEAALQTKKQVVDKAVDLATKGSQIGVKIGKLATEIPTTAAASIGKIQNIATDPKKLLANKVKLPPQTTPGSPYFEARMGEVMNSDPQATNENEDPQQGGSSNQVNYWDYAALGGIGAVLGGGFLLHTGRSFFDAVHKFKGTSDEPPNA